MLQPFRVLRTRYIKNFKMFAKSLALFGSITLTLPSDLKAEVTEYCQIGTVRILISPNKDREAVVSREVCNYGFATRSLSYVIFLRSTPSYAEQERIYGSNDSNGAEPVAIWINSHHLNIEVNQISRIFLSKRKAGQVDITYRIESELAKKLNASNFASETQRIAEIMRMRVGTSNSIINQWIESRRKGFEEFKRWVQENDVSIGSASGASVMNC